MTLQGKIIKYIPLQQGLRQLLPADSKFAAAKIIKYIPLQQGLRLRMYLDLLFSQYY